MVWDVLNFVLQAAVAALHSAYALLPASPLYIPSSMPTDLATPLGYAAYFLPVSLMLGTLVLYVAGVALFVGVLAVKQFVEAIIP
jgi:hypothetical protein